MSDREEQGRRRRTRRYRRAPGRPHQMTERDFRILEALEQHRYLGVRHVQLLLNEAGTAGVDRQLALRLRGLFDTHRIDKIDPQSASLGPRVNAPDVYVLEEKGAEEFAAWLTEQEGSPRTVARKGREIRETDLRWRSDDQVRSVMFVRHEIMLADVNVALEVACRNHAGVTLADSALAGQFVANVVLENGAQETLKPDSYHQLEAASGFLHVFLEADRSTEESRVVAGKYLTYAAFLETAEFQAFPDAGSVRIAFVTTTRARLDNMMQTLDGLGMPRKSRSRFWFTTHEELGPLVRPTEALFAPVWRSLTFDGSRSLVKPEEG